jgi:hypothetical protein
MSEMFFPLVNYVNDCSNSIPFRPEAHKGGRKRLGNKKKKGGEKCEKRRGRWGGVRESNTPMKICTRTGRERRGYD